MPNALVVVLCAVAGASFWTVLGFALARRLVGPALALPIAPVISEQGKEAVVAIVGPGHFFGEGCLNGHPLRIATTRAVDDDCVITRLEKAIMLITIRATS